jgi:undecaprenyl-phosphate 4-deoxy-4-formamido-L-arabinose transferase
VTEPVSVIIPCWRTSSGFKEYVAEIRTAFSRANIECEILLVLDGPVPSITATSVAQHLGSVRIVPLLRNYGQHAATLAGIHSAKFELMLTMDDDSEHDPSDGVDMVRKLSNESLDVVYGVRTDSNQAWWRRSTSSLTKRSIARFTGHDALSISSFRALRRTAALTKTNMRDPFFNLDGYLIATTGRIQSEPVVGRPSRNQESRYGLSSLARYGWTLVTATTYAPLRAVTFAAGVSGFLSLVLSIVFITSYFAGNDRVAGFTALATMTALFGAVQLLALGIIAEYMARIHGRTMGVPTYVLDER